MYPLLNTGKPDETDEKSKPIPDEETLKNTVKNLIEKLLERKDSNGNFGYAN